MNAELFTGPLAQALGWALLHLVWQATIVAGILAGVLALLSTANANARYAASCSALLVVFTMFVATAARSWDPTVAPVTPQSVSQPETVTITLAQIPAFVAKSAALGVRDRILASLASARASFPLVVGIWLLGVALLSLRLTVSWARARRSVHHGAMAADLRWQRLAARISEVLGLRRAVTILQSASVEVPFVIGSLRPIIVLPASTLTGLTPEQIEMVLAHELAHIRRHDFLVNLLQAVVETLMFYHPAVWWMSHRVRVERENCCDDLAVAVCGNPVQYARALARLEELRAASPVIAVAADGSSLLERIRRIGGFRAERTAGGPGWTAAAVMTSLLLVAVAVPSLPAFAQREKKHEAAKPRVAKGSIEVVAPAAAEETPDVVYDDSVVVDVDPPEAPAAPEAPELPDGSDAEYVGVTPEVPAAPLPPQVAMTTVTVPAAPAAPGTPVAPDAPVAVIAVEPGTPVAAIAPLPPAATRVAATPRVAPRAGVRVRTGVPVAVHDVERVRVRTPKARHLQLTTTPDGQLTVESLIALRAAGVTPQFIDRMRQVFPDLELETIVSMASVGVTPEYLRDMRSAGITIDDADAAIGMRAVGVTPEYYKAMKNEGLAGDLAEEITGLRAVGVTPEWLRSMRDAGVRITNLDDAAGLRALGVTPVFVRRLTQAGYTNLTVDQLESLAATGVNENFINDMQRYRRRK